MVSKYVNPVLLPLLLLGVIIALWSYIAVLIPGFPTPGEVWSELLVVLSDPIYDNGAGDQGIALQLGNSLARVFGGFALAIAVGVPAGLLIGMSKNAYAAMNPYIQILKPVSPLAWLPLALFVFKEVNTTAIFVIFVTSIWPIIINTALGVRSVSEDYLNVAKVLQLSPFERVFQIILPVAVPFIFTGMRLSLGIAWLVIVAAEMLTGGVGIGFWIWDEYNNLNYSHIIIGIILIGVIGYILDALMGLIADFFDYRKRGRV
ncbi:MAG: nitrate ABC transporter permease [Sulfuricurvum sp.]|jgi:nitrate/nitrite transport system permease protein|uniref:nitrate ABC transporter permease n=1 Tax=Sulfuricurvum sp. TaxID=2025608 RepID=UPI0025E3CA9A|nr:nitrate ABC transporter permease [Sulfuricurvum sp.]MCK9372304.1 nitrate ABC transporter permease [Sulfuricurvum sp.]